MRIHDWWAFGLFIALAICQTFIAVDSGYLAVFALPREQFPRGKRRRQHVLLSITGLGVLAFTLIIGVLADREQFESKQRAAKAEDAQTSLANELAATEITLESVNRQIQSAGKNGLTPALAASISQETKARLRANMKTPIVSSAEGLFSDSPASIETPLNSGDSGESSPASQTATFTKASVDAEIAKTLGDLDKWDKYYRNTAEVLAGAASGQKDNLNSQLSIDAEFRNLLGQRQGTFIGILLTVVKERKEISQLSPTPAAQADADERAFGDIVTRTMKTPGIPETWPNEQFLRALSWREFREYVAALKVRNHPSS